MSVSREDNQFLNLNTDIFTRSTGLFVCLICVPYTCALRVRLMVPQKYAAAGKLRALELKLNHNVELDLQLNHDVDLDTKPGTGYNDSKKLMMLKEALFEKG